MKYKRLIIGAVIAAVAFWAIVGEQMSGVSANAFVNAQIVTVRTSRTGNLALQKRLPGSFVNKGEILGQVTDPLADNVRLNDIQLELDKKKSEIERLRDDVALLSRVKRELEFRTKAYRERRVAEVRIQLERAHKRLEILENQNELPLAQAQVAGAVTWTLGQLPGEPVTYRLALEHARERVDALTNALAAAQNGIFLGDGYNDAPNSEQRSGDLAVEIEKLAAALRAAEDDLKAIRRRLLRERLRFSKIQKGEINAPTTGLYWEVIEADGVNVQRGDPIVRLVDCSSTVVSLSVSELLFNSLEVGRDAKFRFMNDSKIFDGYIIRLAGSGAERIYDNLAIAPGARHLERFDVTVHVPALVTDAELACDIGRTGRVFFERRPFDFLRGLIR